MTRNPALLRPEARWRPARPNLILNPRLPLDIVGVSHPVELAYLVASDGEPSYRVGVIKSFADRGGKTDKSRHPRGVPRSLGRDAGAAPAH